MTSTASTETEPSPDELAWPDVPDIAVSPPQEQRRKWGDLSYDKRYELQHESLLRIVRQLAEERGYEGTQITTIVALAGVSRRTFYEHFESKDACFGELLLRVGATSMRRFIEVCEREIPNGPYATFLGIVTEWSDLISGGSPAARPVASALWSEAQRNPDSRLAHINADVLDRLTDVIVVAARRLGSPMAPEQLRLIARHQFMGMIGVVEPSPRHETLPSHAPLAASLCASLGFPEAIPAP